MLTASNLFYALAGGILPAMFWLWFWLREDPHPEPRRILILTFSTGILMVPIALLLEKSVYQVAIWLNLVKIGSTGLGLLVIWAAIEEYLKYFAAKKAAFKRPTFDEPVDAPIYLITAALGFAAMENVLFLFKALDQTGIIAGLLTGNLRFLGATLLHTVTSALLGASIAFSFFHKEHRQRNVIGGLLLAIVLHTVFNFFIIKQEGVNNFNILFALWITAIILIYIFEKIKRIRN